MSRELLAAEKLLEIALSAIVGDAASEGAKRLWKTIKNRLQKNQPDIEAEIVELEQNLTQEKLKQLESPLDDEMQNDRQFAEEISKLGREIAQASGGDNITTGDIKAETGGVAAGKIDAPNSRFGGSDTNINLGKELSPEETVEFIRQLTGQANSQTTSTYLIDLPPNLKNWVERKEEIEKIEAWLNNPQATTVGITEAKTVGIQGLGGVGKSTLAAYFYESLDFEAKFWADVSQKPDFTVFAEKIIKKFTGKPPERIDITELINNLLQLLSQRRCLLVVDNLETLLDEERNWQDEYYQDFFSRWLQQGTNSTLFITTQDKPQSFKGLKYWHYLEGMEIAEGVELLKKFDIVGTKEELENFVKEVNGHPLTIKLVAGYLREYCGCQLNQLERDYKEIEGEHRNEQNTYLNWIIQKHLERLSKKQKQFITNLSVYRLPFNCEAASYQLRKQKQNLFLFNFFKKLFSGGQKSEIKETDRKKDIRISLQELCNRSLLIKSQDNKFQFESLVKKYIQQQSNNLTNAHQQAIEYYQANLKEKESWQVLEDVSEYLEIVDHRCELKQYAEANESLNICNNFLDLRGYYSVLVEIYEKLIPEWQQNLPSEERSELANSLGKLGNAYHSLGKIQRGIEYYQQSLKIQKQMGNLKRSASSLMSIGNAYNFLGDYLQGIEYNNQSLEIQQQIGEHKESATSLMNLGTAYFSLGKYKQAFKYNNQSLKIQKRIGDRHGEAKSLTGLGNIDNSLGKYQQAIRFYQQSLEIKQQIGDRNGVANSLIGLGNAYCSLGEYERAIEFYQQSLKIKQDIGNLHGVAVSLQNLGIAYYSLGEYERAIEFYQQSLKIKQDIGDRHGEANSLNNLGNVYKSLGEYSRARDYLQQSLEISQQIGTRDVEAESWFNLGDTRKNLQQKSEAKTAYENARKLYQAMKLDKKVEECNKAIQDLENDNID